MKLRHSIKGKRKRHGESDTLTITGSAYNQRKQISGFQGYMESQSRLTSVPGTDTYNN
jgi:hypothetical protein